MANEFVVKNGAISPNLQLTGSTSGSSTLVASATASGTLTLPAATDTLVGKATTDTLTNKTIAAGSNTISGLTNSNLSGSAGITNANLANSSITINGSAISLGGSVSNLALTTGNLSQFAATTSAQLLGVISDETGSGALVFGTSPTITTSIVAGSASMDIFNTTATTVNAFGAATTISLGAATGTLTLNNANTVITGNLTVNGTTTTINATTITVDDINIELGSVATPTDITAAGGGITLKGATDKTISWSSTNGWTSSETFNLASGKTYKINGTDVLSSSTLGSGVTASSLTSVGTITTGTWSGSFGAVSGANLTSLTAGNLTGTIPSTVLGNSTHYIGTTAVTLNRASANLALTGISSIALPGATSGTITMTPAAVAGTTAITIPATAGTLVTTGDTGSVTSTMIADGTIVNADINASAAIAVSKLAASTISGVTLGNNLNTLTLNVSGTGLSGSTTYNGSAAVTFTVTSNATNANTASTIVARDASGNFSAGTITAALSGNATTATTATNLAGGSAGTIPYQSAAGTTAMLAAGTSGYFLKANGAAAPSWAELSLTDLPDAWTKKSVRVATTAAITLSAPQTIDGIAVVAGDRVLVKDQATAATNGIYVVAAGAWTRATDANTASKLAGACVNVDSGTANGGFRFDTDFKSTDTLDTTAVSFYRVYDANDAATANTANKLVLRDGSGNFSAGTITATLSGNASTATSASQIDGIEFRNGNSTNGTAPDNITDNGTGYVTTVSLFGQTDGALYSQAYSSSWVHQIYGDYRTGQLAVRGKNNGTWQAWRSILDSSNYSSYALPLSGGTLTGKVTFPSAIANRPQFPGGLLSLDTGDTDADIWGISRDYYPSNATAANAWGMRWNAANNEIQFVGAGTNRHIFDLDNGNITTTGAISSVGTNTITNAGFAGIEYWNNGAWQVYIGSENNTTGARYNSRTGVHTWYNNGTQTAQLSGNNLTVVGTLYAASKSFLIPHPTKEGKKLRYGSLEGPENGVYVRGKLKGSSVIELPDYWTKLVDPESITVNLTCIGKYQKLYVMEIKDNKVYVGNENLWGTDFECFYTVYGERVDVDKLEVEID